MSSQEGFKLETRKDVGGAQGSWQGVNLKRENQISMESTQCVGRNDTNTQFPNVIVLNNPHHHFTAHPPAYPNNIHIIPPGHTNYYRVVTHHSTLHLLIDSQDPPTTTTTPLAQITLVSPHTPTPMPSGRIANNSTHH